MNKEKYKAEWLRIEERVREEELKDIYEKKNSKLGRKKLRKIR